MIKSAASGGILIASRHDLQPILIYEGTSDCQVLVIQIHVESATIRIIGGYGPQENSPELARAYRDCIEENVMKAKLQGHHIIIQEDANAKIGWQNLKGEINNMSPNGKLLYDMVQRTKLVITNTTNKCVGGPFTRVRKFNNGRLEQSTIDYVITSKDIHHNLVKMNIDSKKVYPLVNYKCSLSGESKYSDHYTLIAEYNIRIKTYNNPQSRREIRLLRDIGGLAEFNKLTSTKDSGLSMCFQKNTTLQNKTDLWFNTVNSIINRCFRKIRITKKPAKRSPMYLIYVKQNDLKLLKIMRESAPESILQSLDIEIS